MPPPEYPILLSVAEAQAHIARICATQALQTEIITLEYAHRRILAEVIHAPFATPPFANSAMDGFAVRGSELPAQGERTFFLAGTRLAGDTQHFSLQTGQCMRITTGAPLPEGADTVVLKENVRVEVDQIIVPAGTKSGANVRPVGEDYEKDQLVLQRGDLLTAARIAALASFGLTEIQVTRRLRVALFSTGDELISPSQPLAYGQIYDSNRYALYALLSDANTQIVKQSHVRDDVNLLRSALITASTCTDLIITSGGVSAGEADFLPQLASELGQIHFWKVCMKPGMPVLFAQIGNALWFGLPGNPVSSVATFLTLVRPAIESLQGNQTTPQPIYARLSQPLRKTHNRREYRRGYLQSHADGTLWVTPHQQQGSGMLRGLAEANCLLELAEETCELAESNVIPVLPFSRLLL